MTLLTAWPLGEPSRSQDRNPRTGNLCAASRSGRWWYRDWHSPPERPQHHAQDIFAPRGTPVLAPVSGRVVLAGTSPRSGRHAYLTEDTGRPGRVMLLLAHLDRLDVREGDRVEAGMLIGSVGTSGNALLTCPHLHIQGWTVPGHEPVNLYSELQRLDPIGPLSHAAGETPCHARM